MGEIERLLACRTRKEKEQFLADVFQHHRNRLRLMIALRLNQRLQGRIDPSDVLQDAFLEVFKRLDEYLENPPMTLFLWMRRITGQKVLWLHRKHLVAKERDARREAHSLDSFPEATSAILAAHILCEKISPSKVAAHKEARKRLQDALDELSPLDREIIALRHFEELTNKEVAQTLSLEEAGASKRYVRALGKLRAILSAMGIRGPEDGA